MQFGHSTLFPNFSLRFLSSFTSPTSSPGNLSCAPGLLVLLASFRIRSIFHETQSVARSRDLRSITSYPLVPLDGSHFLINEFRLLDGPHVLRYSPVLTTEKWICAFLDAFLNFQAGRLIEFDWSIDFYGTYLQLDLRAWNQFVRQLLSCWLYH